MIFRTTYQKLIFARFAIALEVTLMMLLERRQTSAEHYRNRQLYHSTRGVQLGAGHRQGGRLLQPRDPPAGGAERAAGGLLGSDPAVIAAFETVPREYFHYIYSEHRATPGDAYETDPKPWGLGYGSALSDYLGQAYMTQVCKPQAGEVTLEIGTGSGFQSALLSRIVKRAYSIEIIEPLGKAVSQIFAPLGYGNVHTRVGDGYYGWPEVQGGFDIIIVTCAAQYAPPDLFKQMKPGGRLVIPIGQPFKRGQVLYVYTKDGEGKIHSKRDMGVFFIPMTGAISKTPAPHVAEAVRTAPTEKPASE
jgi:protein-L-isoaspartate(D-aspartate) O-methyltransferase